MSRLSVYWPEEANLSDHSADEPRIIPFRRSSQTAESDPRTLDVVTRARLLFSNRRCQDCSYPVVEPIELADSVKNRNGLAIPGTATLVGFRCCGCKSEWSV
ncbi:hypothetical protein [Schlesneria sp. DSM 10557]|uniref:hypothetical protein n=1 Tax=Schlesneria sp. DSM 10557 TaxID=3044399 RepID=UPI00359F87F4